MNKFYNLDSKEKNIIEENKYGSKESEAPLIPKQVIGIVTNL